MTRQSKTRDGAPLPPSAAPDVPGPAPATVREAVVVPPAAQVRPPAEAAKARPGEGPQPRTGDRQPGQARDEPTHPGVPLAPPGIVPESDVRVHSPAAARPQPAHGIGEELGELPRGYGDGRLVSMVRDPVTLYVYWDFSSQQIDQAFLELGAARAVLKVWNARSGDFLRDVEVHLEARGWYLRELPPAAEIRVELWAVGARGSRMMRAARPLRLPAALPSDVHEAFFVRLPLDQPLPRDGVSTARPLNYGGSIPAGWERRAQPRHSANSSLGGAPGSLPSSIAGRLPWSGTHLMPDLGDDD